MLTLVWDVDDVLNDLTYRWLELGWKAEHRECMLDYGDLCENPPHRLLGSQRDEYLASLDTFRSSEAGRSLKPNPELLTWFWQHGSRFRHIALTARPIETAPQVAAWVMEHFGVWIRCFGIVPTRGPQWMPVYDVGKGEYLRWLGAGDVLIDDTTENLRQAEEAGLKAIVWPQPWNSSTSTTPEILEQLTNLAEINDRVK